MPPAAAKVLPSRILKTPIHDKASCRGYRPLGPDGKVSDGEARAAMKHHVKRAGNGPALLCTRGLELMAARRSALEWSKAHPELGRLR